MRATKKEVGVEDREGTGSEEVRMLCGPPGTYKEAGCGAKARQASMTSVTSHDAARINPDQFFLIQLTLSLLVVKSRVWERSKPT